MAQGVGMLCNNSGQCLSVFDENARRGGREVGLWFAAKKLLEEKEGKKEEKVLNIFCQKAA